MNQDKKRDVIRPYIVDGIQEYDNPMPGWWLAILWGTIAFGVVYLAYFHALGGKSLQEELADDMKAARASSPQPPSGGEEQQAAALAVKIKDPATIEEGKKVYATNCVPCHGPSGEGVVGPNLTDNYWIHGGRPEDIVNTIANGVVEKGMLAWKPMLGDAKVLQVAAFVVSLKGTNPPNGKAPEGAPYEGQ